VESNLGGVVKDVGNLTRVEVIGKEGRMVESSQENPILLNLYKEGLSKVQKGTGGRKTSSCKGTQCARDKKSFERLVLGDDIDMDRVVEFSEQVVVDRVRGKK
jgi:hypothetical protein